MQIRMASTVPVEVHPSTNWAQLRPIWEELHKGTPGATVFSSAEWVDAWLTTVGRTTPSEFLLVEDQSRPVAICLLTRSTVKRGPFSVNTLWLGTAGEPECDSVYVEFGDAPCLPGSEMMLAESLHRHLMNSKWDEFVLPRMNQSPALEAIRNVFRENTTIVDLMPSRFLDLNELRDPKIAFEETLPRKLRQQVRQSMRIYEEEGEVRLRLAESTSEALVFLDELAELHEERWKARGMERGAFGSQLFRRFHRKLIETTFEGGGVQLAKISEGTNTIGLVYNLVSRQTAYFYQCGLSYHANNRVKPGFVCQVLCVNYSNNYGLHKYDFMGGDTPYKKELGKYNHDLVTVTFRRTSLKMHTMELLLALRKKAREVKAYSTGGTTPK